MKSLRGQRVLITGPARGIGAEAARLFAKSGARVALVGLEKERLRQLCLELGPDHLWQECDVTDHQEIEQAVQTIVTVWGGLDVVIANAGIGSMGTVAISPIEVLEKTIDVNLMGAIRTVSATLPAITQSRGYYLLVSSSSAITSIPGTAAYAASKVAIEHFGNILRLELAHKGVDVGVILSTWIETDLIQEQRTDLASFDPMIRRLPWPFRTVNSVETCAKAYFDAVQYRRRKKFVPGALGFFAPFREMFQGLVWEYFAKRRGKKAIPQAEEEVRALGRFFGKSSVASRLRTKSKDK